MGPLGEREMSIAMIVSDALDGASEQYLQDIAHGRIHNIVSAYLGGTADECDAFADEFGRQAKWRIDADQYARWDAD